jgi:hypothetical protein
MSSSNIASITEMARVHYENLTADILNAHTRIEHIRITTLAQEAANLYTELQHLSNEENRRAEQQTSN